jgi:ribosomal protein S27E
MNNYQNKAREEILDFITVRCKDCKEVMDQIILSPELRYYCKHCKRDITLLEV